MTDTPRKTLTLKRPAAQPESEQSAHESTSRTNRLLSKRIIRREELPVSPAAKPSSPKNERFDNRKKPAVKTRAPKPKVAATNVEPPPSKVLAHTLNEHLFDAYPVWANYQPLALGVEDDILAIMDQQLPPASKRVVQRLLRMHCRHGKYLQAVLDGSQRFTLAGESVGEITDEERRYASRTLETQAPRSTSKEQDD